MSLPAVLTIATGLVLLVLGVDLPLLRCVRSAGRFDLVIGVALVMLGTIIHQYGLQWVTEYYLFSFSYFLFGTTVFRTYYVLTPENKRRKRDLVNLGLPGTIGVCGIVSIVSGRFEIFIVAFLVAVLTSLVGLAMLVYDGSRLVRGQVVRKRDVLVGLVSIPLAHTYFFLTFMEFTPPP